MSFESEKINAQLAQLRLERERLAFDQELRLEARMVFAKKMLLRLFVLLTLMVIVGWYFLDQHVYRQNECQLRQLDIFHQAVKDKFPSDSNVLLKINMLRQVTYPSQRERWTGLRDYFNFYVGTYQSSGLVGVSDLQVMVDRAINESKGLDVCK